MAVANSKNKPAVRYRIWGKLRMLDSNLLEGVTLLEGSMQELYGPSGFVMGRDENRRFLGPHQQRQMPAFLRAGHRSPELGERPTAGSDEGSISTIFPGKY